MGTPTRSRWSTESKQAIKTLRDIPPQLKANVVFDQSVFVKEAISTVLREGGIGVFLTGGDDLGFPGKLPRHRRRVSVDSLSVMITFFILHSADKTIDSMVLERPGSCLFAADRRFGRGD